MDDSGEVVSDDNIGASGATTVIHLTGEEANIEDEEEFLSERRTLQTEVTEDAERP